MNDPLTHIPRDEHQREIEALTVRIGHEVDARDRLESDLRRYRNHLDDIRCAILDTGHPLGDDSDTELTPLRLVKEVLAKLAALGCDGWRAANRAISPEPEPERDAPQRR